MAASRSDLLAQAVKARSYTLCYFQGKSVLRTIGTYFIAAFHTLYILFTSQPRLVLTINQPVFLPMIISLYSRICRCSYVIDSHSGLFNKGVWRCFIPIMKPVYRSCLVNVAHNKHDARIYESWGVKTIVMGTEYYQTETQKPAVLRTERNIVVIGTFAIDEPTAEVVAAAERLPDVSFYITGPREKSKRLNIAYWPQNVVLTGFLAREEFLGLVKACDGAMVLVKTDNTMQNAAWEALSCGTPLIISNWPVLREAFPRGAVYVDNSTESIAEGVFRLLKNKQHLKIEILELSVQKKITWEKEIVTLKSWINQ